MTYKHIIYDSSIYIYDFMASRTVYSQLIEYESIHNIKTTKKEKNESQKFTKLPSRKFTCPQKRGQLQEETHLEIIIFEFLRGELLVFGRVGPPKSSESCS